MTPGLRLHRAVLAVILVGNAVAFGGVDPVTRALTAVLALVLVVDLRRLPEVPRLHRVAAAGFALLAALQLLPLPAGLRNFLQPGLAPFLPQGPYPLSAAPWATLEAAATVAVAGTVALTAARMAATRTGLPALLLVLGATGALAALLGLVTEPGLPGKVLLVRENTGGGGAYGPFVNRNHFALAMELTVPALLALLAAAARHLRIPGESRKTATIAMLASGSAVAVGVAALLRSGSRGGVLFLAAGLALTLPLWSRRRRRVSWAKAAILAALVVGGALAMAWQQLPLLGDRFQELVALEGVDGNTRLDLWEGALRLWARSPAVGCGIGAFPFANGLDKPPTAQLVLRHAHNDWLEFLADGGLAGAVILLLLVAGLAIRLRPARLRELRFEHRYALAAAAAALVATGLHEVVGFGLRTPLNGLLAAAWVGLAWGAASGTGAAPSAREPREASP